MGWLLEWNSAWRWIFVQVDNLKVCGVTTHLTLFSLRNYFMLQSLLVWLICTYFSSEVMATLLEGCGMLRQVQIFRVSVYIFMFSFDHFLLIVPFKFTVNYIACRILLTYTIIFPLILCHKPDHCTIALNFTVHNDCMLA